MFSRRRFIPFSKDWTKLKDIEQFQPVLAVKHSAQRTVISDFFLLFFKTHSTTPCPTPTRSRCASAPMSHVPCKAPPNTHHHQPPPTYHRNTLVPNFETGFVGFCWRPVCRPRAPPQLAPADARQRPAGLPPNVREPAEAPAGRSCQRPCHRDAAGRRLSKCGGRGCLPSVLQTADNPQ